MHVKRQLLFVQGGGEGTHDQWDHKLVESLRRELGHGYEIHYPRMPSEDASTFTRGSLMKSRQRRMSTSMHARFRKPMSIAWRGAAINSTTI